MIKKNIFLLCIIFGAIDLFAQAPSGNDLSINIPKIIPPSPNASALEKYGDIPVDYSTGVPSISYPIWSWQRGKFSYSIGLSYHAGGHKLEDMASNVGLGWSVSGMGRISRTVRGRSDDMPVYGFIYTPPLLNAHTFRYDGGYKYVNPYIPDNINPEEMITKTNSSASGIVGQIVSGRLDGEQDLFSINVNNISCRFIIDKNKNIVPLEKTNLKIEIQFGTDGRIMAVKVTDDKGLVYTFDKIENQNSAVFTDPTSFSSNIDNYTSGWLISKVFDPATGESILFNYTTNSNPKVFETGFSQAQSINYGEYNAVTNSVNRVWAPPENSYSYNIIGTTEPILQNILFPDSSSLVFGYDMIREDFINDKALTTITIKSMNNNIFKKFKLNYSYYSCPNEQMSGYNYPSGNNYNKRLRLDKIDEYANDDISFNSTSYTYNSLPLNRRDSRNLDYWGYNVNPSRNNLEYVPAVPLAREELYYNTYQLYIGGADRRPDEQYVMAGILEKIQYPTGGFTSFQYECNKAFSAVDYYEDKLVSNTPEWIQTSFGQNNSIGFPLRSKTAIEFLFKTQEFNPRPVPNPNDPQTCFADNQDLQTARFEITSTDGTFSTFIEKTYGKFLGGIKQILDLPIGKNYNIKFVYNASINCSFIYPFKAFVTGIYYKLPGEKLAGGIRIKKIISNDGSKNAIVKEYNYNNPDGTSSATLNIIPNFNYYRSTSDAKCISNDCIVSSGNLLINQISRSSSPIYSLDFHNNSPLVYTKVTEKELDSSSIERYYDPIYNDYSTSVYPYLPIEQYPQLSGMLTKELIKNNAGDIKREKTINYNKSLTILTGDENINIRAGKIAAAYFYPAEGYATQSYKHKVGYAEDTGSTVKVYENGSMLVQTDSKTYDPIKKYLRTITTTNSKSEAQRQEISYSFDMVGAVYNTMVSNNMLNYKTGSTNYKSNIGISKNQTNYSLYQSGSLPMPSIIQSSFLNNNLETDISFNDYDNKGNILQYTAKDGIVTSFVWGYNKQYPVAQIRNAPQTDFACTSFEDDGKGNWNNYTGAITTVAPSSYTPTGRKYYNLTTGSTLSKSVTIGRKYIISYWSNIATPFTIIGGTGVYQPGRTINGWTCHQHTITTTAATLTIKGGGGIDEVRLYPQTAQMTTYTYEPLVGITSECDINNRVTYYEYDGFSRLILIRDQDKKIVKKICYNYSGQAENCTNPFANAIQSGVFIRNNCGSSYFSNPVTYMVPANTYSSAISLADANQQAQNDVDANGQAYANAIGTCTLATIFVRIEYTDWYYDLTSTYATPWIKFYSNLACTIPVSVNALAVNYKRLYTPCGVAPSTSNFTISCSGFQVSLGSQLVSVEQGSNCFSYDHSVTAGNGYANLSTLY